MRPHQQLREPVRMAAEEVPLLEEARAEVLRLAPGTLAECVVR